jgi:predicted Fe-S protein YdhL (DUF1289 family)
MIPSPCVKVCVLDRDTGWCLGCLRDLEEIAAWSTMDDAERLMVLKGLDSRRASLPVGVLRTEVPPKEGTGP